MKAIQLLVRVLCVSSLPLSFLAAQGEAAICPMLRQSQLGNVATLSAEGLLVDTLRSQPENAGLSLQILESHTVCLGQGTIRNTYRSVSVVVRYFGSISRSVQEVQVEYQCIGGEWGSARDPSITKNPVGGLTSALRTDCSFCIKPDLSPDGTEASAREHCISCPLSCTGQMRCGGLPDATCCNYFDMAGSCTSACPTNSQPNNVTSVCECQLGYTQVESGNGCVNIDECQSNPCDNGATCTDTDGSFTCQCLEDWGGRLCDKCSLPGCVNCTVRLDQNRTVCSQCVSGFVRSSGGFCKCNIDGCSVCSESGLCQRCDDSHRLTSDSRCTPVHMPADPTSTEDFPTRLIIGVVIGLVALVLLIGLVVLIGAACTCPCGSETDDKVKW